VIFHGSTPADPNWYKWVDGHFRGSAAKLAAAKEQLEREAAGKGTAWGNKLEKSAIDVLRAVSSTPQTAGHVLTGITPSCAQIAMSAELGTNYAPATCAHTVSELVVASTIASPLAARAAKDDAADGAGTAGGQAA
jgi:hypothetical protein